MKSFSIVFAILLFVASPLLVWADGSLRGSNTTFTNAMERKLAVDDRTTFNPVTAGRHWTAVGLVETEGQSCTGVLVGPDLLLTTACCGLNRQPDGSIGWLRFTPAKHDGESPFGIASGKWWFWHHGDIGKLAETNFEMAFNYVSKKVMTNEISFTSSIRCSDLHAFYCDQNSLYLSRCSLSSTGGLEIQSDGGVSNILTV